MAVAQCLGGAPRSEAFGDGLLHYAGNSLLVALGTTILTIPVSDAAQACYRAPGKSKPGTRLTKEGLLEGRCVLERCRFIVQRST